jgi:hypothetical protein
LCRTHRGGTTLFCRCHLLVLVFTLQCLFLISRAERPRGSLLPFGRGHVSTAICFITKQPSLSPHSSACAVTGQSCDCPSTSTCVKAGRFRFTMFPIESCVGWVLPLHRWLVVYGMRVASAYTCPLTFWRKPPSLFVPDSQSPLACYVHDVYQQFTFINPSTPL